MSAHVRPNSPPLSARRQRRRPKPRCRLHLEALEDRCLLSGDVILDWNATLINAIETARMSPLLASRSMAMVHVAMYDAIDAVEPTYTFYPVPGLADAPPPAAHSFPEVAAATAADLIMDGLFPTQAAAFDAQLQSFLAGYPKTGHAISASLSWGQTVANAVLTWRSTDGSNAVVPYTPGTGAGVWQPTPPAFLPALGPQWPLVTPWAMTSGSQFRPPPPPALTSSDYAAAFNEVETLGRIDSTTRTADQTQIALFWKDAIGTAYAFGHWNKIAEGVSVAQGLNLMDDARLFALLNVSTADALISCWDAKYAYNFWRPVTAIHFAGDSAINPATVSDPTWAPLIVTPNFPSYMSAHSTVSGASATVLTALFGPDYAFSVGSDGLPGVTRSFSSFADAAAEAGQSRIYGGIHFQFDNQTGLATGGALGQFVVQNFLVPVPQQETQVISQARLPSVGASGLFVAQNLLVHVPMGAVAFLVTGPTNGAPASGVIPGGQQTMTATLPVSVLASPNSAWATGHKLVTQTPPGKPAYPRTHDRFFADAERAPAANVFGDDMAIIWPH